MISALQAAQEIRSFLADLESGEMSDDARHALKKDTEYIEKSISVLSSPDKDAVDSLWREVQYFSRFFGGDYAKGDNDLRLAELCDRFHEALLEQIVSARSGLTGEIPKEN